MYRHRLMHSEPIEVARSVQPGETPLLRRMNCEPRWIFQFRTLIHLPYGSA